jgi:hypothetical protein
MCAIAIDMRAGDGIKLRGRIDGDSGKVICHAMEQGPVRAVYETSTGTICGVIAHPAKHDRSFRPAGNYDHARYWAWSNAHNNWTYTETVGDEMLFSPLPVLEHE